MSNAKFTSLLSVLSLLAVLFFLHSCIAHSNKLPDRQYTVDRRNDDSHQKFRHKHAEVDFFLQKTFKNKWFSRKKSTKGWGFIDELWKNDKTDYPLSRKRSYHTESKLSQDTKKFSPSYRRHSNNHFNPKKDNTHRKNLHEVDNYFDKRVPKASNTFHGHDKKHYGSKLNSLVYYLLDRLRHYGRVLLGIFAETNDVIEEYDTNVGPHRKRQKFY
ncbi:unnamed protein product [Heterobilharzia americana]|nr:unnamed protein product [Heterobilharzia americana]CAH8546865.1 unnamed protein product [Heterobilharzia americana]